MTNERMNEGPSPAEIKELNEKTGGEKLGKNKKIAVGVGVGVTTLVGSFSGTPGTEVSTSADGNQLNKNPSNTEEKMPGGFPSKQALKDFLRDKGLTIGSIKSAEAAVSAETNNDVNLYFKIGSDKYLSNGVEKKLVVPVFLEANKAQISLRVIAEETGNTVDYSSVKREFYLNFTKEEKDLYLKTGQVLNWERKAIAKWGEKRILFEGKWIELSTPIKLYKNKVTVASLRDIATIYGCEVNYVTGGHVYITKKVETPTETENQTPEYKARKVLYDEMQKIIIGKPNVIQKVDNNYLGIHTQFTGENVLHFDKSDVENYLKTGTATGFEVIKDSNGIDVSIKMKNEFGLKENDQVFDEVVNWLRINDSERFNRMVNSTKFFAGNWGAYGMVESVGDGTWYIYFGSSMVAIESTYQKSWERVLYLVIAESIAIEKANLGWSARDGGIEKGTQMAIAAQDWLDRGLITPRQLVLLKSMSNNTIKYYEDNFPQS